MRHGSWWRVARISVCVCEHVRVGVHGCVCECLSWSVCVCETERESSRGVFSSNSVHHQDRKVKTFVLREEKNLNVSKKFQI